MQKAKNKKFLLISLTLFMSVFVLTGCSKISSDKQTTNKTDGQANNQASQGQNNPRGAGRRLPDFGQPNKPADIRGVVKSVTGNEATVIKIDVGAGGRNASSSLEKNTDGSASTSQNKPSISLAGNGAQGNRRMMGGTGGPGVPGGAGGPEGDTASSRVAMLENIKAMSTGEEKIVIPVGIQMLKSNINSDTKKSEMIAATLGDVTTDKMITIWLNASFTDKKIAEFILIN